MAATNSAKPSDQPAGDMNEMMEEGMEEEGNATDEAR